MRHFLNLREHSPAALRALADRALMIKRGEATPGAIKGRTLVMLFFNSSLRTRASFEAAMGRFGGSAIVLNVGSDKWSLETRDGVRMDGDAPEHVREAAAVLGRYGDAVAVRSFATMRDHGADFADAIVRAFAAYADVPVISMESASEHPCQGLTDWVTMIEQLRETRGRRFTLTWAPHVKPLPMAVPHSAVLAAAAAGMLVTIARPRGYALRPEIMATARQWAAAGGGSIEETENHTDARRGADVLYVKSWGAAFADNAGPVNNPNLADWLVTRDHLGQDTRLMHCLPVRRNVVIADDALDDPRSVVIDQAENRLWAQAAILDAVFNAERGA